MKKPIVKTSDPLVVGVGSALVDILLRESDEFVTNTGGPKGGMTLVDSVTSEGLLSKSDQKYSQVPGGSACNTIIGIGKLGNRARFIGKRGDDQLGILFENALKASNVEPVLTKSKTPTGRVLSIITPDAQRTMFTFLGASSETTPEELSLEKFRGASLVHIEGYMLFNENLILAALRAAKNSGALISLDLASFTVVEASKKILSDIINEYVDILIANEDEARAYTGKSDETDALSLLAKQASIAVLKIGKRGSYIAHQGKIHKIGIMGDGTAVDTTGAGDLWASGFLYGLVHNYPMEKCGSLGAACGYEVCQVIGAQIPESRWQRIKNLL